mmetsp:Transcript_15761/g.53743  ORF Transcript_15761/g.53743 Transcript_15761/m.53743 type:complete len:212 (+) Transcript_15761:322-957(+)
MAVFHVRVRRHKTVRRAALEAQSGWVLVPKLVRFVRRVLGRVCSYEPGFQPRQHNLMDQRFIESEEVGVGEDVVGELDLLGVVGPRVVRKAKVLEATLEATGLPSLRRAGRRLVGRHRLARVGRRHVERLGWRRVGCVARRVGCVRHRVARVGRCVARVARVGRRRIARVWRRRVGFRVGKVSEARRPLEELRDGAAEVDSGLVVRYFGLI